MYAPSDDSDPELNKKVTLVARTDQFTLEDDDRLKFEGMFALDANGTVDPHVSTDGGSSLISMRRVSKFR